MYMHQPIMFYQVESIYLSDGSHWTYGCAEANTKCLRSNPAGMALSHCCMNELSTAVKDIMRSCEVRVIIGNVLGP